MERSANVEAPSSAPRFRGLRATGQFILGMLAGGFAVQGLIIVVEGLTRVTGAPGWLIFLGLALCPVTIIVTAVTIWRRGHTVWAVSLATGAIVWTSFLIWLVYEFAKGMSRFP